MYSSYSLWSTMMNVMDLFPSWKCREETQTNKSNKQRNKQTNKWNKWSFSGIQRSDHSSISVTHSHFLSFFLFVFLSLHLVYYVHLKCWEQLWEYLNKLFQYMYYCSNLSCSLLHPSEKEDAFEIIIWVRRTTPLITTSTSKDFISYQF